MKVSILSIGDELTFGEVIDTNAAHISEKLYSIGVKPRRHLTVGDVEPDIVEAIGYLSEADDVVIITGGLGPTADDLTAKAAAKAAGSRLVLSEEALSHTRRMSCKLGGNVAHNEKQALLPAKATVIPNPIGTACGFQLVCRKCRLFFMPGVPSEMARMLEETVIPELRQQMKRHSVLHTRVLKVFGLPEAEADALLSNIAGLGSGVTVAFGVEFPEILVKLRGEGENERLVSEQLQYAADQARLKLRDYVYAEEGETMDSVVAALFRATGLTLSLAESCTGGLVAKRITDMPGSSGYFLEGAVTYSNAAKIRMLDVPAATIEEHGAVSPETVVAMARGVRTLSGSDLALAVTGIAGPDGGSAEKPVGTVYIALADCDDCHSKRYNFTGNREEIRAITAFTALDWLRRYLQLRANPK